MTNDQKLRDAREQLQIAIEDISQIVAERNNGFDPLYNKVLREGLDRLLDARELIN